CRRRSWLGSESPREYEPHRSFRFARPGAWSASAACGQPGGDMLHERIAQPSMLNAFHRFADEGLDQERLGFFLGNSPRFEVKQETFVEAACGSAVAALDVVSEDLQLRLVVRLCSIRKQQRVRGHLGFRLLRAGTHDDPALKHGAGIAIEHSCVTLTRTAHPR